MKNIKFILISLLLSTFINIIIFSLFYKEKQIAVVDLQSINDEYTRLLVEKNPDSKNEKIKLFVLKTNKILTQISKENNLIILPKQAVFSGENIDLTKQIRSVLLYDVEM